MSEITQADREAAKPIAMRVRIGELTEKRLVQAFAVHREAAAAEERAKIVAWLRTAPHIAHCFAAADAIEAGEHLK